MHIVHTCSVYLPRVRYHQQLIPHCLVSGPLVFRMKGSILTQSRENMEARSTDHITTIVGVLFCLPIRPLRNGYRCKITQKAKKSFPKSGPHDWYPLFMASEIPATTPTKFMINMVVGGMRSVVHLKAYSSAKSSSSDALEVTVKFVSIPANIFRRPWITANRWAEIPPMTQNCSFLHHSSMLTPLHLSSRIPVMKIERKREMKKRLAKVLICNQEEAKRASVYMFI